MLDLHPRNRQAVWGGDIGKPAKYAPSYIT